MVVHILVSDLKLKKRPRLVREGKGGKKGLGIKILFFFFTKNLTPWGRASHA